MGKKILLADDSITIQKVIELTFSDEDFEVVTVGNGRLALEKLAEVRPDIVLCDIIMPEKDGYEVCEQIKKSATFSHLPVLLLTGAFEPFDQERAARAGYDGFAREAVRAGDPDREGQGPARARAAARGGRSAAGRAFRAPHRRHSTAGRAAAPGGVAAAPFMSHLKIGFIAGIMLMVPVLLRQVWLFIAPGLLPRERKYAGQFVFFATIFFAVGVLFCFFILLPIAVPFLISYKAEHLTPIIKIGDYIDFTLKFMLATGAVFELPLIMILLGRMGILNVDSLVKFRKYAFLIAFIIGGLITPTPDAFNMTIMSIPIYLLYEIGILGVRILGRPKEPGSTSLTEI